MSEEQKIIDLENEITFLKDVLSEKQKEIEEKNVAINKMSKDISRQLKEIERLKINLKTKNNFDYFAHKQILEYGYISKDKIRDMLNYLDNTSLNNYEIVMVFRKMMKELLEENDGDHIPRID